MKPAPLLLALAAFAAGAGMASAAGSPFLSQHATGWFWYREPAEPARQVRPPPDAGGESAEVRAYRAFKADLQNAMVVALFNPTPKNVERYAKYQTALVNMSSRFADVFQRVVWANPRFDFTQQRPVDSVGLSAWKRAQADRTRETLARLARTDVVFFFFRSDCPYCHAVAPILKGLARATGLQVYPVSLDGGGLPEFPQPHLDRGQARVLGVPRVPAIYLADPGKGRIEPVSFGTISQTALIDRIVTIAEPSGDRDVDAATPRSPLLEGGP